MEERSRYVRGFAREWAVAEERGDATSLEGVLTGEFVGVEPAGFKRRGQSKPMEGEPRWES